MKDLSERIKDLENMNDIYRNMNSELRTRLQELESENIKDKNLLQGYKKVIEELTDKLRKKGS
jgi:hypothetical protein